MNQSSARGVPSSTIGMMGQNRAMISAVMTDLFQKKGMSVTDRERAMMFDILTQVVRDAELVIRKRLAKLLAKEASAPLALISFLANDEIAVAYPVLLGSQVLNDNDLVEVVYHRTVEHKIAVARRRCISETVSKSLVEKGETPVMLALLENQSAKISAETMEYLVEQSRRIDSLRRPLVMRTDLEEGLALRMFGWVSSILRNEIATRFSLPPEKVKDLIEIAAIEEMGAIRTLSLKPGAAVKLVNEFERGNLMSSSMAVKLLNEGHVALFIEMLRRMTGLPDKVVKQTIYETRGDGFVICCKSSGFSRDEFITAFRIIRGQGLPLTRMNESQVGYVTDLFDRLTKEAAGRTLGSWLAKLMEPGKRGVGIAA